MMHLPVFHNNIIIHCSLFLVQEDPDYDLYDHLKEKCAQLSTCQKLYSAFEEFEVSLQIPSHDEEVCSSKFLDYSNCVDRCVSNKYSVMLKVTQCNLFLHAGC